MKHLEFYIRFLLLTFYIVGGGHQDSLQAGVAWANDLDNVLLNKDIPARINPRDTARLKEVKLTNDYYRWEVTTNATLALSRFAGNTTRSLDDDPYMLMVRKFDRLYNDSGYLVGSAGDSQGVEKPLRRHNWRLGYNGYVGTA